MRHPPRVTKAAQHLFKKFKKTTQKAAFTKKEKELASRAFVAGVCALAELGESNLTKQDWEAVFSILAEKLMEYEF